MLGHGLRHGASCLNASTCFWNRVRWLRAPTTSMSAQHSDDCRLGDGSGVVLLRVRRLLVLLEQVVLHRSRSMAGLAMLVGYWACRLRMKIS